MAAGDDSKGVDLCVGIITNSDDRVLSILSSLGLSVNPRRYGTNTSSTESGVPVSANKNETSNIDFLTLSYDVGFEKPSRGIFDAAKQLGNLGMSHDDRIRYIHVGDDLDKDLNGAQQAQWEGLLLHRGGQGGAPEQPNSTISDLLELTPRLSWY